MNKLVTISIAMLILIMISGLTHTESWMTRAFAGRSEEMQAVHEQVTDISWILLLCTFSLLLRFRKKPGVRMYLMAAFFLLFALAALHSHPLWSSHRDPVPDLNAAFALAHIDQKPASVSETGLRLDDVVTAMAFDPQGNLWLSTPSSGPYCYQVHANEVENLLRPDVVYGFAPDAGGMWVLTSRGAFLYNGPNVVRHIQFPEAVIPLCAVSTATGHLFGTTRGLFAADAGRSTPAQISQPDRIVALHALPSGAVLVGADSGFWRWTPRSLARCSQPLRHSISGMVGAGCEVLAGTGEDGIVKLKPHPLDQIRFAVPELNIISPGASAAYRGLPCFGTYGGAVVCREASGWKKISIGEFPVTALASDHGQLYAWSGGRLLEMIF